MAKSILVKRNNRVIGNNAGRFDNSSRGLSRKYIAPPGPPPFSPSDLGTLSLYLRADTGVTYDGSNLVSQWDDQSGNANHFVQATGGNKPFYNSSVASFSNKPTIGFDGNRWLTKTFTPGTTALTVAFVIRQTSSGLQKVMQGYANSSFDFGLGYNPGTGLTDNSSVYFDTWYSTSGDYYSPYKSSLTYLNTTRRYIATLYADSNSRSSCVLYQDGISQSPSIRAPASARNINYTSTQYTIGSGYTNTQLYNGHIAAVLIYSEILDSTKIADLDSWLQTTFT